MLTRRSGERLTMTVEHRAAASTGPHELCLRTGAGAALALAEAEVHTPAAPTPRPAQRILEVLAAAEGPLTRPKRIVGAVARPAARRTGGWAGRSR
ncbi:hypothetical protein DB30_01234 [Enhygromyxa salina]|uniref:Uncharacterized protein n=1 Tax=Enhygromyxa salina TaxID=215803 RepID=A0A0C2CMT2_9BACT|nr:hypothetical protein [Enhygromyxa salina]KIG12571.1 hypothetical protein DB30_01234 [Enhygromyxa salina]